MIPNVDPNPEFIPCSTQGLLMHRLSSPNLGHNDTIVTVKARFVLQGQSVALTDDMWKAQSTSGTEHRHKLSLPQMPY